MSLAEEYRALTRAARRDLMSDEVSAGAARVIETGLEYLARRAERQELASRIPDKKYFVFRRGRSGRSSRPVNHELFDVDLARENLRAVLDASARVAQGDLTKVLYTMAMSYCCANDLQRAGDQKTPGTFFELLIGHLVARVYGVNPERQIEVLNLDLQSTLPTDFVFDLGPERSRIHMPVKTSTRERVIQVWAHQRVLDGVYGVNRFRGVLVCMAETNKQTRTNSVIEVCLPGQWAIYQMFIAQLHRVYYLDVPARYRHLPTVYPFIQVKTFASFFDEAEGLVSGPPMA